MSVEQPERCKDRRKITDPPFWDELQERCPALDANPRKQNMRTNALEQKENTGRIFKVCVFSHFLLMTCCFFSQLMQSTQFSYSLSFYRRPAYKL